MESSEQIAVTLADGRDLVLKQRTTSVLSLDFGGYLWRQTFTAILMAEYDIILGKPWHSDNQPQMHFTKNLIKLQDKDTTRHITMMCLSSKNDRQEEKRPPTEFMSVKQAQQALMNRGECIIGMLARIS